MSRTVTVKLTRRHLEVLVAVAGEVSADNRDHEDTPVLLVAQARLKAALDRDTAKLAAP